MPKGASTTPTTRSGVKPKVPGPEASSSSAIPSEESDQVDEPGSLPVSGKGKKPKNPDATGNEEKPQENESDEDRPKRKASEIVLPKFSGRGISAERQRGSAWTATCRSS